MTSTSFQGSVIKASLNTSLEGILMEKFKPVPTYAHLAWGAEKKGKSPEPVRIGIRWRRVCSRISANKPLLLTRHSSVCWSVRPLVRVQLSGAEECVPGQAPVYWSSHQPDLRVSAAVASPLLHQLRFLRHHPIAPRWQGKKQQKKRTWEAATHANGGVRGVSPAPRHIWHPLRNVGGQIKV